MEKIRLRSGDDLLKAASNFCKNISISTKDFVKTIMELGDKIDMALGHESMFAATAIMDIISTNKEIREVTKNLITLYGIDGLKILFIRFFPKRIYGDKVLVIENTYNDEFYYTPSLVKSKPYVGYSDPKHKLPCKLSRGFKRQNQWNRTRSNPKLR